MARDGELDAGWNFTELDSSVKKSNIFIYLLTGISIPLAANTFIADSSRSYSELVHEAMDIMHRDMHAQVESPNPDTAFAEMMIPHHQGAIDMSKALLLHGKDPALRNLALQIIAEQRTEIDLMKSVLKRSQVLDQRKVLK